MGFYTPYDDPINQGELMPNYLMYAFAVAFPFIFSLGYVAVFNFLWNKFPS